MYGRKMLPLLCLALSANLCRSDAAAAAAKHQSNIMTEYSITPSSQLAYYHYPAPKGAALNEQPLKAMLHQYQSEPHHQQQQQQYSAPQRQQATGAPVFSAVPELRYAPSVATQQQYHHHPQPEQQQQQYRALARSSYAYPSQQHQQQHQQQQAQHSPNAIEQPKQSQQLSSPIARQFSSPALDNAAFMIALRNQGFGGASTAASLSSSPASPSLNHAQPMLLSMKIELRSLNVKLPVPIGITPINIAPLPLQAGAPYSTLRGVTSYGTLYPQR